MHAFSRIDWSSSCAPNRAPWLTFSLASRISMAGGAGKSSGSGASSSSDASSSCLHITVSSRFLRKLQEARTALSHTRLCASAEDVLEGGLDLLLEKHRKRKGLVQNPQKKSRPARADTLTADVRRTVRNRD